MIYDIGLTIGYRYQRAAVTGRHLLRLMPADLPGQQRRLNGSLAIAPTPFERRDVLDFFGNDRHPGVVYAGLARRRKGFPG